MPIRYRFDSNLFILRWLQAKTKVLTDVLDELLYADDINKMPIQGQKCKKQLVSQLYDNYDLRISTERPRLSTSC